MENWTNLDKGREGVKNPGNFADIICTWPQIESDEGKNIASSCWVNYGVILP